MALPLEIAEGTLGVLLVVVVLRDVFGSIVMPRPVADRTRLARLMVGNLWRPWRWLALRQGSRQAQESMLGAYGPAAVVLELVTWVLVLVLAYGLVLDALRSEVRPHPTSLTSSMYFAATSLLTIGFGDFVPMAGPARLVALAAGATGLGMFALVMTFLFSLFAAFQRREVLVVTLEAAAGAPPSGVTLLETYLLGGLIGDLPQLFQRWQQWAAEVLDSHLAYPLLGYFRSSHDNDSWISSLGAVMDAATLILTTVDIGSTPGAPDGLKGWAKLSRSVGGHCIEDLVRYFELDGEHLVGVELEEYRQARERLVKAGYALRAEPEAWEMFQRLRSEYAGRVNALASYWASPPALWIGDRSPLKYHAQQAARAIVAGGRD